MSRGDAVLAERALEALEAANVPHRRRKETATPVAPTEARELDLALERSFVAAADQALERAGFHRLRARGHPAHRFYVAYAAGSWVKVDIKIVDARDRSGRFWHAVRALSARVPLSPRRLGAVVAILGPDGAGKGTVISQLVETIPFGTTVVYFGFRTQGQRGRILRRPTSGPLAFAREWAFVGKKFARHSARLILAYGAAWRGQIVLCDRHPLEALAVRGTAAGALVGFERGLLVHVFPRPDAIVVLDAPEDVLRSRKQEHSQSVLGQWREAYRTRLAPWDAHIVSATTSVEETTAEVSRIVWEALSERRGWSPSEGGA